MSDIGHNNPPPFEAFSLDIDDLYATAKDFLDGQPIENEGQAEAVAAILDHARKTWKAADAQRAAEKKPHDDAAKAVQALWLPLLDRVKKVENVAKAASGAYLLKKEAEQLAAAEAAREEAERLARIADQANATARHDALEDQEALEIARKAATAAAKLASKADKAKPNVASGGRAIGLRTYWIAELVDPAKALGHYRATQPEALKAWLLEQAQTDVSSGARFIPGINVKEERRAA